MSVRRRVPFAQIPEWIIRAPVSSHAKVLWAALDRFADLPYGAMPSRAMLAAEWLGVSVNTLDRAKAELVEIGALTVEERPGETNLYWLEDRPTLPTGGEGTLPTDGEGISPRVGNEREQGKESKEKENAPMERARTPRDEVWDALTALFGVARTRSARTLRGKVVASLLDGGVSVEEIESAPALWERKMPPGTTFTETALEKHLDLLLGPMEPSNGNGETKRFGRGMTSAQILELGRQKGAAK